MESGLKRWRFKNTANGHFLSPSASVTQEEEEGSYTYYGTLTQAQKRALELGSKALVQLEPVATVFPNSGNVLLAILNSFFDNNNHAVRWKIFQGFAMEEGVLTFSLCGPPTTLDTPNKTMPYEVRISLDRDVVQELRTFLAENPDGS